ncbi:hypothetical protein HY68_01520 [Streptomyces sp. AcH 505]|uniref:hypothetical protein n=1 Tax=Streptomyces sp. AcH 505 TaxID=352211 RepID=UPI000591F33E|nr:hypothetical protein HY68_01520 [Streptomyces sp. AcH 505]
MPDKGEPEDRATEEGELVNLSQLAAALGVTRQWLHTLRTKDPAFPESQRKPGSTREFWDLAAARRYYGGRELRPGARTDLKSKVVESGPAGDAE